MAKPGLEDKMRSLLTKRKSNSALRSLSTTPPTSIDFSSNDFLSLSTSPILKSAYLKELESSLDFRLGSGGSRLLDGNSHHAEDLEQVIAKFHGAETALLFNSGFDANSGFFSCVPQAGDVVLYDEFIHASVHEGMRLSRAGACIAFKHNSVCDLKNELEAKLKADEKIRQGQRNVFVAVESLYSMDGDLAPLRKVVELVESLLPLGNGKIVVDEAHSNGIYGYQGRGIVCSLGLENRVFMRLHTFGKALSCTGAALLCSTVVREYLINYARSLIYTTSMSFPSLTAIKVVYSLFKEGATELLINHLVHLINHLYTQLQLLNPHINNSASGEPLLKLPTQIPASPIFAIFTPEPRSLARYCQSVGFVVRPIVPPTVPEGTQRVRVCLHAGNTVGDVERLVESIRNWLQIRAKSPIGKPENLKLLKAVL